MPELNETITTRKLPETELAEAIAEYCRVTAATLAEVRFLRRAIEPPNVETCTYQMQVAQGGTGEWDNVYPCRELGTVCNLADARDADTPGALYCARHQQQRDKEQGEANPKGTCPRCGSADWMPAEEGAFAACNDCGFTDYDEYTLQLMAEVQREQKQAKQILGYVPSYTDAVQQGLAK